MKKYLLNCFLLLIPLFLWNIILAGYLPYYYGREFFDNGIPILVSYSENILRIIVFAIPLFMVLSLRTRTQKIGLFIYLVGVGLYFSSWLLVIFIPESDWSQSLIGFMAPAYTTIIWFIGIGLIGQKAYVDFPNISQVYIFLAVVFVIVHTVHTYLVYHNLL